MLPIGDLHCEMVAIENFGHFTPLPPSLYGHQNSHKLEHCVEVVVLILHQISKVMGSSLRRYLTLRSWHLTIRNMSHYYWFHPISLQMAAN